MMASPRPSRTEYFDNDLREQFHLSATHLPEPTPFEPLSLWAEFSRSRSRISPPISPSLVRSRSGQDIRQTFTPHVEKLAPQSAIDFRALEYVSGYDTNLMCPICHVPFIEPVVLDCEHTFCEDCFDTYHRSVSGTDRSRCPACRAYQLGGSRRANRLIRNMASEVRVKCPNSGCDAIPPRSAVEIHTTRECPEQDMLCPGRACDRQTKRKNFVPDSCIHETHVECDCGATIRLGRGEWIRHKDEECPNTVTATSQSPQEDQINRVAASGCPGVAYGCAYEPQLQDAQEISSHISACPLARLAPFLEKQELLIKSLRASLDQQSQRNAILEAGFNNMHDLVTNTVQPRLERLETAHDNIVQDDATPELEVEEIPRSPVSLHHPLYSHGNLHYAQPDPALSATLSNLTERISNLEYQHHNDASETHRTIRDLDARNSLALMNETLRIREELAHLNGGMYSTRAQVTYLLNHHRLAGQQAALNASSTGAATSVSNLARDLSSALHSVSTAVPSNAAMSQPASTSQNQTQSQAILTRMNSGGSVSGTTGSVGASASAISASTSPTLVPIIGSSRPVFRRGSAGSASGSRSSVDRVKL